ncbi:hypothetical protein QTJ16_001548 [Diplocarpon rosae]|uniref:Delta(24)-sterol reductase n=1 Tax=Diplocarpon rosae TaxID=946125 RepID=A0AAD9T523_9HELO|nr:hypothetical protein QTJ16_001548 [Diplocarpon rosae]PBP16974.1 24-dehydrocholesterol reductase precursor [Diplocarpon rosae]
MNAQGTAINARLRLLAIPKCAARHANASQRVIAASQRHASVSCIAPKRACSYRVAHRPRSCAEPNVSVLYRQHVSPQSRPFSTNGSRSDAVLAQHQKTVEEISARVGEYHSRGEKFRIYHGGTNSTRPNTKKNLVDTSKLSHVLSIDIEAKTCLVEPNVPMDRLVEATMARGLVPPVVMEFPGITVGGGYSGTSGESSSFKHGFFDQTVNWVEMVLADGEVVRVSPEEKADLFHGAAGAVGTLGVITLLELRLQDAKKYVETTYHPVSSMAEAIAKCKYFTSQSSREDYVDGIMFSQIHGGIITGRLTDTPRNDIPVQCFSAASDPWFYLHVEETVNTNFAPVSEAIPLAEYLFRYDRGGFWVGKSAFDYFKFPFNDLTRRWLDDFLHTRMMYTALHASGQSKRYVVQDLALPYDTAEEFVKYTDEEFGIWPLWLCPLKQSKSPTMHPHTTPSCSNSNEAPEPLLNIGLWGHGPKDVSEFIRKNRALEHKLTELGGMKWLYAHTYYSEAEFWAQFDREWYEKLREKYKATGLPSVYEKVKVDTKALESAEERRWPMGGIVGIKKAIESKSYVDARKSSWKTLERPSLDY